LTRGQRLNHPTLVELAKNYDKSPAQILIRWSLQYGLVVIPKSIRENRIRENIQVFDFQLKETDMKLLNSLNEDLRTVFL
jgi:diketogulonate reductase-like aldo/keto reductase